MNKILFRPLILISIVLGLFIVVELIALGGITWRNLQRIETLKQDILHVQQLQQLIFQLHHQQLQSAGHLPEDNIKVVDKIIFILQQHHPEEADTLALLDKMRKLLHDSVPEAELLSALLSSSEFFSKQLEKEEQLLSQVHNDSELELNFALIFPLIIIACLLFLTRLFFRKRVMAPLNALEKLLRRLTDGEMQPMNEESVEPVLKPLFTSYNRLIIRLTELEDEHIQHTQLLEQAVRQATHTLLEQSHSLARAERLAAVGELAASAAHELRNPLAGIQAALANIRSDCQDTDLAERIQLVSAETTRLTKRLNDLLAFAKHTPEKLKPINLQRLIGELITLLKYQISENIHLKLEIATTAEPLLPEIELRQALLNLLLNSIQELDRLGGIITVKVFLDEPAADSTQTKLRIIIHDTGAGFPNQLINHGIKPFVSTREHGTGLGLSMVQRFARSLGGNLQLQNDAQGHAFATLTLPI